MLISQDIIVIFVVGYTVLTFGVICALYLYVSRRDK